MSDRSELFLQKVFRFIVAKRWWVIGIYAVLLGVSIPFAIRVDQDNGIDRLIVKDDPDYVATEAFGKVFGGGEFVVLFAEAERPFAPDVIATVDALEKKLVAIPRVSSSSLLSIFHRARPDADPVKDPGAFQAFATGTDLFRKQGLVGENYFGLPLVLDVHDTEQREETLKAIDEALADQVAHPAPLTALRKVGEPYVNQYLNHKTAAGGLRLFPVFGVFVILLCWGLYRSGRALFAIVVSMLVNVALCVGYIGMVGGTFSIVSVLVPMTVMVTCLANLVYIHSRYVEQPPDRTVDEHQVFSLANKFLPCTASVFASAAGFAALYVSEIRPIRELGVWLAVGLVLTWVVSFTLFPALQKAFHTPTQVERKTAAQWFKHAAGWMPAVTYRARWWTVVLALALSAAGAVALFGIPGYVAPMKMLTDPIEYVNSGSDLYKDTRRVGEIMPGLSMAEVWLKGKVGSLNQPEILAGLDDFQQSLEKEPMVGSAVGVTNVMRVMRYIGGKGDTLPDDPDELADVADNLETVVQADPLLARFVDAKDMSQTHITLVTRINEFPQWQELDARVATLWARMLEKHPALKEMGTEPPRMVGAVRLQSKVSHNLVPTLTESFALTVAIIFSVFLLVFRNGAARIMAMIPSLFAILVMFGVMRLTGMSLNVATILIASTVLGTSENDQIHFFYHFLERKNGKDGSTEAGLRHTIFIAGRSIFFATLINAVGFLAFALSDLPPIRQFAILAALAFALSMIADFTALPGALWMIYRDRPDARKKGEAATGTATPGN